MRPLCLPVDQIAEYRLLRPLGAGMMGEVFLAYDTLLDRPVAIKLISRQEPDRASRERFLLEARAIARLHHPNVVAIYRVGEWNARPFLISEYVRGQPLDQIPLPLPRERLLPIALDLACGLAAAHRSGVLHRDIKPGNAILAETGEVKLLDFGLAKLLTRGAPLAGEPVPPASLPVDTADTLPTGDPAATLDEVRPASLPQAPLDEAARPGPLSLTVPGTLLGTPLYLAPEAWRGEQSPRTDVYALGVMLYELCTGTTPYGAPTLPDLRSAATTRDAPPVAAAAPSLDPRLSALIDRCLRRDPAQRFASAVDLYAALSALERNDARRARLLRYGLGLGLPAAAALSYGGAALRAQRQREHQIDAHTRVARRWIDEGQSQRARLTALRQEAFTLFDDPATSDKDPAERVWENALALSDELAETYHKAGLAAESALALDPARAPLRGLLARVLMDQAALADQGHHRAERDALLRLLRSHDPQAALPRAAADPPAPPPRRASPTGLVYVPPGTFLYGCAEDDRVRRNIVRTQPLHPVRTAGYFIGRTEVTFADWIEFLRALPPEERGQRLPGGSDTAGRMELREPAPGSFVLVLRPGGEAPVQEVPAGAKVRYEGRTVRADQDWLRFPVSAISVRDARAYLSWLDRSGKVPGARLCTEHEWERAARGGDGRTYPHGERLGMDDANFDQTYGRKPRAFGPDEVGSHPVSASPFGALDMSGNVWEWTTASPRPDVVVMRGGSWWQGALSARVDNRQAGVDSMRHILVGLRVCASADVQ